MPEPVILSFLFNEFMVYAVFEVVAIPVEVPRNILGKIKFKNKDNENTLMDNNPIDAILIPYLSCNFPEIKEVNVKNRGYIKTSRPTISGLYFKE